MTLVRCRGIVGRHRTTGTPSTGGGGAGLVGVLEVESNNLTANGNTTVTSANFTPALGELLVVKASSSSAWAMPNDIAAGGLIWSKRATVGTPGTSSPVVIWTAAVGTTTEVAVSVVFANSVSVVHHGAFVIERYTGATLAGTPAVATLDADAASPYQTSLTTTAANAVVTWMAADYNGVNGTVTYVGAPTQTYRYQEAVAGTLSFSTAIQNAPTVGTQTFGLSAPAGQVVTLGGLELIPGTPTVTPTAPATQVVLDGSTPAVARRAYGTGAAVTSASFTPPAGALQVAVVTVGWGNSPSGTPALTLSDSTGGTWTQRATVFGEAVQCAIFTSPVGTSTARTVVATSSSTTGKSMQLAVRVLTGAATSQIGATATSTTGMASTITTTTAGSYVLVAAGSGTNAPTLTPTAATTATDVWQDAVAGDDMAIGRASALTSTPGATSVGWTQSGRSVAVEVLPASSGGGSSTAPLISSLSDNANTGALSALWTPNGAGVTGNRFYVNVSRVGATATPIYSSLRSAQGYQWSGSSLTFQVVQMPGVANTDTANAQFWIMDPAPAATVDRIGAEYVCAANRLDFLGQTGATYSPIVPTQSVTYSAATHQWFRFEHTGSTINLYTSPDKVAWTLQQTFDTPPAWTSKTTLIVSFEGFRSTGTNDTVLIDNVN